MRRILSVGGVAAVMAVGLGATSALAVSATTWTVKPGGAYTSKAGTTTLTDMSTGSVLTCTSSTANGTLKSGSKQANPLGTVTTSTFSNCTGPAGLTFKVKTSASTKTPWDVNGVSYKSGTTNGTITHIHSVLTGTNNTCVATVDGTGATKDNGQVAIQHKNSASNKLSILGTGGNLHAYNVSTGCLGAINSGDAVSFKGTYTLNKGETITSP